MTDAPSMCPLCAEPRTHATGRTHEDSGTLYTQYGCAACAVEFWWPLKNPGAKWYSEHERYSVRNSDPVWQATANHRRTLSLLKRQRGAVLDVGCGIGNFLSLAKEQGWTCAGIDFDPDAIEAARTVMGIDDVEATDIVSYVQKHPGKRFNLVTFFDVLEHVDNHNEFIGAVRSLLNDGGSVAMSMPYRAHAIWLMKGDLPPAHLTCWDRTSLRRFLEARGFEVTYMRRSSEGIWPIVMKLRFRYGKWASFGAVSAARRHLVREETPTARTRRPVLMRSVHMLAKLKDLVLFGLPALVIWLVMLPTAKRYVDLFAIARKRQR